MENTRGEGSLTAGPEAGADDAILGPDPAVHTGAPLGDPEAEAEAVVIITVAEVEEAEVGHQCHHGGDIQEIGMTLNRPNV